MKLLSGALWAIGNNNYARPNSDNQKYVKIFM